MARTKDGSPSAPVDRAETLLEAQGEAPITVGDLIEVFKDLPPETTVSLCVGPYYEDVPMTDAILWPAHGGIFLLGNERDDDDEEDAPIEGEWVELPRTTPVCTPEVEEGIDLDAAEPA